MRGAASLCLGVIVSSGCQTPPSRAPMDLVHAQHLVIAPEDEREYPTSIILADETRRRSLVAPAPAEFRFRLELPQRAFLSFALGMTEAPGRDPSGPSPSDFARFVVRTGEPIPDTIVFQEDVPVTQQGEWLDRTVDLTRWSGDEINLIFNATFPEATHDGLRPLLAVFAEPIVHDRAHFGKAPGVVVVSIDSLRRDRTSLYGYPRRTTPGLERLAQDAVVFDDAYGWPFSPGSVQVYLMSSKSVAPDRGLGPDESSTPTLAASLGEAGYVSKAIVTHRDLPEATGLAVGFDRYRILERARAEAVTDRAIDFLNAWGDREFLLFVDYSDVRGEHDPPPPFDSMFGRSTLRGGDALYDGGVRYVDKHVERLLTEMKRLRIYEPSIVVVVSAHDRTPLWNEPELRVPLVVKFPDNEAGGSRSPSRARLIDVAPTLLGVLGIEAPAGLEGVDLRDQARGPSAR